MNTRQVSIALWVAIAAQFLFWMWTFDGLVMGDGFIVARYAENLVDHGELAFNLGERIWSFTSPLHVLLVAVFYQLTGASIAANQFASVVSLFAAFALLVWGVCRTDAERLLTGVILLLSPCLVFWTTAGLETPYLTLLISALVVLGLRASMSPAGETRCAAICLVAALAFLCRYDSALFTFPVVLLALGRARPWGRALSSAMPAIALVASWVLFAHVYYGDFFPTSFYTKRPSFGSEVTTNAAYLAQFTLLSGLPWLFVGRRRSAAGDRGDGGQGARSAIGRGVNSEAWWLFAGLLLVSVYGLSAATKHMMFSYRLVLPYLPALIAGALVLRRGLPSPGAGGRREPGLTLTVLTCAAAMVGQGLVGAYVYKRGVNPSFVGEFTNFSAERMQRYSNEIWEPLADDIRRHWARHPEFGTRAPRLYTWEAGQVPYRMKGLHVYDNGLISWRHDCEFSSMASADYLLIWPGNPKPPGRVELITRREAPSSAGPRGRGAGSFALYANHRRQAHRLPPLVRGRCTERPWIRDRAL